MVIPMSTLSTRQAPPSSGHSALPMQGIDRPVPNLINPETRGPATPIVMVILLGLVTIVLGIRIYTRCRISRSFGTDDVLIILAFVPSMAFAVVATYALFNLQWDRHAWDMIRAFRTPSFKVMLTMQILFCLGTNLTKLSMLSLIHRLVVAGKSRMRYVVQGFAVIIIADTAVFILVDIFQCRPVYAYWTLSLKVQPGVCLDEGTHMLAAGIINSVTDVLIVLLPLPVVMKLQMPLRERWAVYALFTGGILASIAGAIRTYYTWVLSSDPLNDSTWHAYPVTLASAIELYTGLIVVSLPATKPFFRKYVPQLLNSQCTHVTEPLYKHKSSPSSSSSIPTDSNPPLASHGRSNSMASNSSRGAHGPRPGVFTEELFESAEDTKPMALQNPAPARALASPTACRNFSRPQQPEERPQFGASGADEELDLQRLPSVYIFKPYPDGHISIHMARPQGDRPQG